MRRRYGRRLLPGMPELSGASVRSTVISILRDDGFVVATRHHVVIGCGTQQVNTIVGYTRQDTATW